MPSGEPLYQAEQNRVGDQNANEDAEQRPSENEPAFPRRKKFHPYLFKSRRFTRRPATYLVTFARTISAAGNMFIEMTLVGMIRVRVGMFAFEMHGAADRRRFGDRNEAADIEFLGDRGC